MSSQNQEVILLDKALRGEIRLNASMEVEVYHGGWQRFIIKRPDQHPVSGRYRFRFGKNRDTIYRNRLVWIIANRKLIPDGYFIDHRNENSQDDTPKNLQLMASQESHKQGNALTEDNTYAMLRRWFHFIGQYRREPLTVAEIAYVETGF